MLVDEDAVIRQRLEAVAVEFLCEESFAGAEGVCRIDDDKVVFFAGGAHEFEAVLKIERDARVAKLAGGEGQQLAADLHDHFVDIHHVYLFDGFVARQLAHRAAVAAADDEDAPDVRVCRHRDVYDHVVVDKFVLLGEHHQAVKGEETPELLRIKDVYLLKGALAAEELLFYLY
ncbi:hypothetical protein SDC9_170187 [bioreactor metagenome]|uniref:Uncharacterized protein n=1 Tax=bioreactor metagenome TaxID=1076179 RepID=A0A645GGD5_9ZZZZ